MGFRLFMLNLSEEALQLRKLLIRSKGIRETVSGQEAVCLSMCRYLLFQMVQIQSIIPIAPDLMPSKILMHLMVVKREKQVIVLNLHHSGLMQTIELFRI